MRLSQHILAISLGVLTVTACTKKIDLDMDVEAGNFQEHIFKDPGNTGTIRGDFQFVVMHEDMIKGWMPGFEIGCSDGARNGFKLAVLSRMNHGVLNQGTMYAGISGVREKQVAVSTALGEVQQNQTYHFELSWDNNHHYKAQLNGNGNEASGLNMLHKKCRISATSVHVKFSNLVYETE